MPSETDLNTFRALHACSTPERWAAFMALAGYLAEHPEQRLGQAVINTLWSESRVDSAADLYYLPDTEASVRVTENHWRAPL